MSGPKTVLEGYEVVCVHKTTAYAHWIILYEGALYWWDVDTQISGTGPDDAHKISDTIQLKAHTNYTTFGNTIIVHTFGDEKYSEENYVFLWKSAAGGSSSYITIANSIPEIDAHFALKGDIVQRYNGDIKVKFDAQASSGSTAYTRKICDIQRSSAVKQKFYSSEWGGKTDGHFYDFTYPTGSGMTALTSGKQYQIDFKYEDAARVAYGNDKLFGAPGGIFLYKKTEVGGVVKREIYDVNWKNFFRREGQYVYFTADRNDYAGLCIARWGKDFTLIEGENEASDQDYTFHNDKDNYDALYGAFNSFVNDVTHETGQFAFPFFARYGLMSHDGSIINMSCPCLMVPNSGNVPIGQFLRSTNNEGLANVEEPLTMWMYTGKLRILINKAKIQELKTKWSGIVDGISIFISQPLYTYDQGAEYNKNKTGITVINPKAAQDERVNPFEELKSVKCFDYEGLQDIYTLINQTDGTAFSGNYSFVRAKGFSDSDYIEKITSSGSFYEAKHIRLDEIEQQEDDGRSFYEIPIDIPADVMRNIVTRESVGDGINSRHTNVKSRYGFDYNSRLHKYNSTEELFSGFPVSMMSGLCEDKYPAYTESISAMVYLMTDEGEKTVSIYEKHPEYEDANQSPIVGTPFVTASNWLYYPDSRAYKIEIRYCEGGGPFLKIVLNLKKHDFLDGAYWFGGFSTVMDFTPSEDYAELEPFQKTTANLASTNKLHVSIVNSPFAFPLTGITTFGHGEILGVNVAVKQLTEGGFGDDPLYVFTTDEGVWALRPTEEGVYEKNQPASREIATSHDGIVSLDDSVAFITERGIKMISGSTVKSLTDKLDMNVIPFGHMSQLVTFLGKQFNAEFIKASLACDVNDIPTGDYDENLYYQFIEGARLLYDYNNKRLYVFNTDTEVRNGVVTRKYPFNMVLSLSTFLWAIDTYPLDSAINSYPEAYAMFGGNLVEVGAYKGLYEVVAGENFIYDIPWLALTRPIKFEAPDMYKTIDSLMLRGHFKTEPARRGPMSPTPVVHYPSLALYGSNDLYNWHVVSSGTKNKIVNYSGTPYRYYRVLAFGRMLPKMHTVSWLEADVNVRLNNKLR